MYVIGKGSICLQILPADAFTMGVPCRIFRKILREDPDAHKSQSADG